MNIESIIQTVIAFIVGGGAFKFIDYTLQKKKYKHDESVTNINTAMDLEKRMKERLDEALLENKDVRIENKQLRIDLQTAELKIIQIEQQLKDKDLEIKELKRCNRNLAEEIEKLKSLMGERNDNND